MPSNEKSSAGALDGHALPPARAPLTHTDMNRLWLLPLLALMLTACRTSRELPQAEPAPAPATSAASASAFVRKVAANAQTAPTLTARIKMDLNAAGSSLSAGGTLRMKRDDVVQLSLTFLGLEVGRLEFTPEGVLIVDRMNKQYVRAAYADVSFLRQAGLDFYTLQALFWNELFVPGLRRADAAAERFSLSVSGDHTQLSLTDTPGLAYSFLTQTATGRMDRVYVTPQNGQAGQFTWTYGDFTTVNGKPFPAVMTCAVTGTGKDMGFTLKLSRIGNDSGWSTRTEVSDKYTRRDADEILRRLIAH